MVRADRAHPQLTWEGLLGAICRNRGAVTRLRERRVEDSSARGHCQESRLQLAQPALPRAKGIILEGWISVLHLEAQITANQRGHYAQGNRELLRSLVCICESEEGTGDVQRLQ